MSRSFPYLRHTNPKPVQMQGRTTLLEPQGKLRLTLPGPEKAGWSRERPFQPACSSPVSPSPHQPRPRLRPKVRVGPPWPPTHPAASPKPAPPPAPGPEQRWPGASWGPAGSPGWTPPGAHMEPGVLRPPGRRVHPFIPRAWEAPQKCPFKKTKTKQATRQLDTAHAKALGWQ